MSHVHSFLPPPMAVLSDAPSVMAFKGMDFRVQEGYLENIEEPFQNEDYEDNEDRNGEDLDAVEDN